MSETTERSQARAPRRINEALLRHLWPSQLSTKQLEHRLGHNSANLYRCAKRMGLPPRGGPLQRAIWAKDTP
jgi:hypothetical protein